MGGRLPTEAEWEYAARAVSPSLLRCDLRDRREQTTANIARGSGKKKPKAYGLDDTVGNDSERVLDRYFDKYSYDSAATGPDVEQPLASNALATARGGFWQNDPSRLRVSHRLAQYKEGDDIPIGFRCASDHP